MRDFNEISRQPVGIKRRRVQCLKICLVVLAHHIFVVCSGEANLTFSRSPTFVRRDCEGKEDGTSLVPLPRLLPPHYTLYIFPIITADLIASRFLQYLIYFLFETTLELLQMAKNALFIKSAGKKGRNESFLKGVGIVFGPSAAPKEESTPILLLVVKNKGGAKESLVSAFPHRERNHFQGINQHN